MNEPINQSRGLMLVGTAAKYLGISRMTLYRWIKAGEVNTVEHGGILFIDSTEVERLKKKATAAEP